MSEFRPDPEPSDAPAYRDLDDCPMKPSLIRGGIVAFLLSLVPFTMMFCCLPLIIASLVAVYDYTKRYGISVQIPQGMKVAILCCFFGYGLSILFYDLVWIVFDWQIGSEAYRNVMEAFLEKLPPEAQEELRDKFEQGMDEMENAQWSVAYLIQQIFGLVLASAIGGAIGGLIGAAAFKKGPEAR